MSMQTCPTCHGTGQGWNYRACGCANGRAGGGTCPYCGGTGKSSLKENCYRCVGTGQVWVNDGKL